MRIDVQHGIGDPNWVPGMLAPAALTRFARAAEDSGYGALGFTDHPAPSARWVRGGGEGSVDPIAALAFCAAVTTRIRLLTWVLVLPYRNPFLTAHQLTSLDAVSGGRLTVGLGTGYLRSESRALGGAFDHRLEAFDDAVEVLRAVWAGGEISRSRDGSYDARGILPQPPPVQPAPPLWIHGNSRWGRERAASYGDGWIGLLTRAGADAGAAVASTVRTPPISDLAALAEAIRDLRERAAAAGRDPAAIEVVAAGLWPMLDVRKGWDTGAMLADVEALKALGVGRVVVVVCGDDPGAAEETTRRFGAEVVAPSAAG